MRSVNFIILVLGGGLFEGTLRSRAHSIELKPQPAVNSFEVSPFSPAFYHGLQLGVGNSPPQIDQPIVNNLTTIFAAPHHNLCCTSPQSLLHLTTIFAAPHHWTSQRSLLHLTTSLLHTSPQILPHHNLCCTSPQTSLQPQILTWLIETLHALQK